MIPIIKLHRYSQDCNQSLSTAVVIDSAKNPLFASISLERGWRDNEKGVSCIPKGVYNVELEWSPKFKQDLWEIKGVPRRSECKFHVSNFWKQLNGCIALGRRPTDIDGDGYRDVTSSKSTMADFHKALKGHKRALLMITAEPGLN